MKKQAPTLCGRLLVMYIYSRMSLQFEHNARHGGQSDAPDPEEPWQHAGEKIVHRKPHIIVMGDVKQERERMEIGEEMQTKQRVRYRDIIEIS